MSVKVMGMVFDACLKPTEKLVLLALADHADHQGANIYPAVETIAAKCGLSARATQRVLRALEGRGVLLREKVGGGKRTNLWRIDLSILASLITSEVTESHPSGDTESPEGCQRVTGGVTESHLRGDRESPDPSYNHPGTVPGPAAPPGAGGEAGAPEGAAGPRRAAASLQGVPESSKPTLGGAAEKPRGGRLSDPISDLIAYAAYSAPRGTKFTSVTANRLLKDRAGAGKPSAADAAALVSDLRAMYKWWTAERPNLSAPGKYESISRALADWKRAKSKCGGLVYAPVLQPDGTYRMEWTHENS